MENQIKNSRKNSEITYRMRVQLIDKVQKQKNSIQKAAKIMNIKLSTAKMILFKYRKRGWITQLKRDKQMKNLEISLQEKSQTLQRQKQQLLQRQDMLNYYLNYNIQLSRYLERIYNSIVFPSSSQQQIHSYNSYNHNYANQISLFNNP